MHTGGRESNRRNGAHKRMETETVHTWRDGGATWIEIRRPSRLNALDPPTLDALCRAAREAVEDHEVRVLLLTGAGEQAFCAGADIAEMSRMDGPAIRAFMDLGKETTRLLEEAPVPTVAVVNGYALGGGCELALACDLVLAAENAQFGLPEVDLAVLPGWGGSQRLQRRVGYGRARRMLFTGCRVSAPEALACGLCDAVAPPGELRGEAARTAEVIAGKDRAALAGIKRALRWGSELSPSECLDLETDLFTRLFDRPERAAAMERFLRRE